jgi:hypothetical protein
MPLHESHDNSSSAPAVALPQIADCGASSTRVMVIGSDQHAAELAATLESRGVIVLTPNDRVDHDPHVGLLRDAHTTDMLRQRGRQSPSVQALMVAALIGGMAMPEGLMRSALATNYPTPPRSLAEQDHARIAAAEAKRARRAAKRVGAQS